MKANVTTSVVITAPPAEVFRYLLDTSYHSLWSPHMERITPVGILKEGMRYHTESMIFGVEIKADNLVTKLVPNEVLELQNDTGILQYFIKYTLAKKDGHTEAACSITVSTDSTAFAFARPVLTAFAKRELMSDLELLKIAVEERLDPRP